ncbi:MAG: isochorismatase family cysteine hydrolase [Salaquimonas sp.]
MTCKLNIEAQPFSWPYNQQLDPACLAILVIDLQHDFLSPQGYFAKMGFDPAPLRKILPNVNSLTAAIREIGATVIHTRQGYRADKADMTPYEKWRRTRNGLDGTDVLLRSSDGFNIDEEVVVNPNDIIIDKTCNDAFMHTELEHVLHARGITHLIFTGVTTDVCVHSTLRAACDRNYQCLTVSDACASGDQSIHEAALKMVLVEGGIFGALTSTSKFVQGLTNMGNKR